MKFFVDVKKNGEGKGGNYLEKKNILFQSGRNREGNGGKYLVRENIFLKNALF